MTQQRGLGRGLEALLPATPPETEKKTPYFFCAVKAITTNPMQPRQVFNQQALEELADSIRENGLIQPLVVREKSDNPGTYELIAGERRWRASKLAGLKEVPVAVKDVSSQELLELALVENIQRQDLNPLEESAAYERLTRDFKLSQVMVAKKVGKERSTVANALRLLQLPDYAKDDIYSGHLSAGHARVLLGLQDRPLAMRALRDEIVDQGLSVRQAEILARERKNEKPTPLPERKRQTGAMPRAYSRALTNALGNYLGSVVKIVQSGSRGRVEIGYKSAEDLERLLGLIMKS